MSVLASSRMELLPNGASVVPCVTSFESARIRHHATHFCQAETKISTNFLILISFRKRHWLSWLLDSLRMNSFHHRLSNAVTFCHVLSCSIAMRSPPPRKEGPCSRLESITTRQHTPHEHKTKAKATLIQWSSGVSCTAVLGPIGFRGNQRRNIATSVRSCLDGSKHHLVCRQGCPPENQRPATANWFVHMYVRAAETT